jgi:hypothetical protein
VVGSASLLLNVLDWHLSTLTDTHLGGKSGVRVPAGGLSGRTSLLHHSVDLLKSKTLGLPNHEVGVDRAEDTGGSPNEEDLGTEVLYHQHGH